MGDDGIFRRPAVPQPVRIRRNVQALTWADDAIIWYEKAIQYMKNLPMDDARSWRYQAAIHDYPDDTRTVDSRKNAGIFSDPLADKDDRLPADQSYWRQCQHVDWLFIPWHRMYIHFFEKIVARIIVDLGGPPNWALPYWDYSGSANYDDPVKSQMAALLPEPFRTDTIPGTRQPNALWVSQRTPNANRGRPFLDMPGPAPDVRNPARPHTNLECLRDQAFTADPSFGGLPGLSHRPPGPGAGSMEGTPHGSVHSQTGGNAPPGYMFYFTTAPLDPIFWLHHCNIDRLWEVWGQRQKTLGHLQRNPKVADWLGGTPKTPAFKFHDAAGRPTTMNTKEVLDTRAAPLSYEYEDTSDPFHGAP